MGDEKKKIVSALPRWGWFRYYLDQSFHFLVGEREEGGDFNYLDVIKDEDIQKIILKWPFEDHFSLLKV